MMINLSGSFNDFSEFSYRELLGLAKSRWNFITYTNFEIKGKTALWRHDVDVSIHRALRLAEIEHEEGVVSTYFLMLHSAYYNLLEPAIVRRVESILKLGHAIGLHFDPSFYGDQIYSKDRLLGFLEREKTILESCFRVPVTAFSWHNPTRGEWLSIDDDTCSGMVNAYGSSIRKQYTYVSDSNGFWRYDCLRDILENGKEEKLHVLTHPEWWQKMVLSPRERIYRCIHRRAMNSLYEYDELLIKHGRENRGGASDKLKFLKELDLVQYELCDYLWNSRMLNCLLIELYRLHERQIKNICNLLIYNIWKVPYCEQNEFFSNGVAAMDWWRLFELVFEKSWSNSSSCSQEEYNDLVTVCKQLFHESTHISSDKIEEGCIYLCEIIENVSKWGMAQKIIEYDGISCFSERGEYLKDASTEAVLTHSKKWDDLKSKLQEIKKEKYGSRAN